MPFKLVCTIYLLLVFLMALFTLAVSDRILESVWSISLSNSSSMLRKTKTPPQSTHQS